MYSQLKGGRRGTRETTYTKLYYIARTMYTYCTVRTSTSTITISPGTGLLFPAPRTYPPSRATVHKNEVAAGGLEGKNLTWEGRGGGREKSETLWRHRLEKAEQRPTTFNRPIYLFHLMGYLFEDQPKHTGCPRNPQEKLCGSVRDLVGTLPTLLLLLVVFASVQI